jgi:hypothetical protein
MIPETRWWNRQLVKNTFLPFEAEQILQIPILNISRDDVFTWPQSKDGSIRLNPATKLSKTGRKTTITPQLATTTTPTLYGRSCGKQRYPQSTTLLSGASSITLYR